MGKIGIQNAEHYTWGNNCDGWHLVKNPSLSVIQEKMPPHTEESLHFHHKAQQFFYILKGIASIKIDEEWVEVPAFQGVHILPKQIHQIRNNSNEDLEFLVISEPLAHGDRTNM